MGSSGRTTINMSIHDESAGPEGYDQPAVEAWIDEHVDSLTHRSTGPVSKAAIPT